HLWADWLDDRPGAEPDGSGREPAGIDIVGIDFSRSIQRVARHVVTGWGGYRTQADALRPGNGVWAFGVNPGPFPLTRGPVPPCRLPMLACDHFWPWGVGRGMVEAGSAFFDYLLVTLGYAHQIGAFAPGGPAAPITVALLCDGCPNGGEYG